MAVSARYWRLRGTANTWGGSSTVGALYEVELTVGGGADLTTGKTASADGYTSTFVPARAIDDDTGTNWLYSLTGSHHWWSVDLGSAYAPDTLRVYWAANAAWQTFYVDYSDDNTNWTPLIEFATVATAGWQEFTIQTASGIARPLINGFGSPRIGPFGFIRS